MPIFYGVKGKKEGGERNRTFTPTPEAGSVKINPEAGFVSSENFSDWAATCTGGEGIAL